MSMGLLVANGEPLVDMQRCLANSSRERRSVRAGKLILTSAHLFPRPLFMNTAWGNVTPAAAETLSIHSHIQTPRWTSSQTLNRGNSADTLSSRDLPVYRWSCQHLMKLMRLDVYWLVLGNPTVWCDCGTLAEWQTNIWTRTVNRITFRLSMKICRISHFKAV